MPPHPLTNFEIQKYYQNEPRFNDVSSIDNLPKIKDGAYVINGALMSTLILEFSGLLCMFIITLLISTTFGVAHIPKEIKTFIDRYLPITTNICRIQGYDSIMCRCFCIGFINFMLAGKTFTELTNLFSPNNF